MWTRYLVRWEFLTHLAAGLPAEQKAQEAWLEARKPKVKPPEARSIGEIAEEVRRTTLEAMSPDEAEDAAEQRLLVFQRMNGSLVVRAATIRAHIKDCATVLSSLYVGKIEGERSFAVRVKNAVYWPPEREWIPILDRQGTPVPGPTGTKEKFIHAVTPRGRISAIKVFEYVDGGVLEFPLCIMTQPSGKLVVSETDLDTIFMYGGTHGYGPERSDDAGRYVSSMRVEAETA